MYPPLEAAQVYQRTPLTKDAASVLFVCLYYLHILHIVKRRIKCPYD